MTEDLNTVNDARLVTYLDGRLSDAEARALEADLAVDLVLGERLAALDVDLGPLRDEMADILQKAPALHRPRSGSLMQLAAAAVIAVALVLGGVLVGARSGPSDDWRDFAAAYHLLYRAETLSAPIEGDGGVARVSESLGQDLSAMAQVEGLDFRRAQVLGWQEQTLVQFAYLDAQGRPVAVCFMLSDAQTSGFEAADRHGLSTVMFQDGALQVLVIGAEGTDGVDAVARSVAARL